MNTLADIQANALIGVWGLGVVGRSVITFLVHNKNSFSDTKIEIFDKRPLTESEISWCNNNDVAIAHDIHQFLEHNDTIIISPGVNIDAIYEQYVHKWVSELDLFGHYCTRSLISITGTVGKTSITTLLSDLLLASGKKVAVGGNIGIACLDLITKQELETPKKQKLNQHQKQYSTSMEYVVLEVSSFQLAYTRCYAPDIAVLTNFSPNHIDWHNTQAAYFKAKLKQFVHQKVGQKALIPFALKKKIDTTCALKSMCYFFAPTKPTEQELTELKTGETLFYLDNKTIYTLTRSSPITDRSDTHAHAHNYAYTPLLSIADLPAITFDCNWLIICSVLSIIGFDCATLPGLTHMLTVPEHRLEKCAHTNNVTIYNDSKATTIASTLAAVNQLQPHPLLLILGGLSKGVDRAPLCEQLKGKVKKVYTFGAESAHLKNMCEQYKVPAEQCESLEEVVKKSIDDSVSGDQILFSPAGSSFDLFKDYAHRGNVFKELVKKRV